MSFLHIIYQGRTATIYLEDGQGLLDRYVNMDTGQMSYTMGKQIGGKPINPDGQLGRKLIRIADDWIDNPSTEWKPGVRWIEPLYGRKKYTSSQSNYQKPTSDDYVVAAIIWGSFILTMLFLLFFGVYNP